MYVKYEAVVTDFNSDDASAPKYLEKAGRLLRGMIRKPQE